MKRYALQRVADRDAEDQRRNEPADEQCPVPRRPPAGILDLVAELEPDRPQDQRYQNQEHGDVEARKRGGIERRPGGERGAAAENEPHLIAFPNRIHAVDQRPPFGVGAGDQRQQHGDTQVDAVDDCETDQERSEKYPPENPERFVIEKHGNLLRSPTGCGRPQPHLAPYLNR